MKTDLDLLIVGAGLVGNCLALALRHDAKIAMIEAADCKTSLPADERTLALSFSTRCIFQALGIWEKIQSHVTPIQHVHVSEAGGFGATRFSAQDEGVEALGYTLSAQMLTDTLKQVVLVENAIPIFFSSTLVHIQAFPEGYRVQVQTPEGLRTFTTRLLVGADGAHSLTRKLLGIGMKQEDYAQTALTAHLSLAWPHQNIAYERFTQRGVLAALPRVHNQIGMVWTTDTDSANQLKEFSDEAFCEAFQAAFGYRLGKFLGLRHRQAYALGGSHALQQVYPHAVLLGNAAHTLHPVAAQGFNLSLRDAAALAQTVMDAIGAQKNPGDLSVLKQYEEGRKREQLEIMGLTKNLVRVFSGKNLAAKMVRHVGFLGLELAPFAKSWMANHAIGMANHLPAWVVDAV